MLRNTLNSTGLFLLLLFTGIMATLTLPYFSFRTDVDFLLTKQSVISDTLWRCAFYTHISTSLFVLLSGGLQFSQKILYNHPRFHRGAGYVYVALVLLLAAPSGFIMALKANGGFAARTSFALTSLLWWAFTGLAFYKIYKGKLQAHIAFMTRSYALTLSAITLRLYTLLMPFTLHLRGVDAYVTVAWLSWLPNLVVAEMLIRAGWIKLRARRQERSSLPA